MTHIVLRTLQSRGAYSGPVNRLVIHCMAERIAVPGGPSISAWQHLNAAGLSAHALIAPDGIITRCVPSDQMAYHAKGYNDRSVGVELLVQGVSDYPSLAAACGWNLSPWGAVGTLPPDPYTEAQYSALIWWLRAEAALLKVKPELTTHQALSPERKFDPGPVFDWARVKMAYDLGGDVGPVA